MNNPLIYILIERFPYDGDSILGVFADMDKASEKASASGAAASDLVLEEYLPSYSGDEFTGYTRSGNTFRTGLKWVREEGG